MYKRQGFSLLEVLVVLAVMALLATVLVPNVGGFLSRGKEKSYNAERETLQLSVDAWRASVGKTTGPKFPILQSGDSVACLGTLDINGNPTVPSCNPYLDIQALADQGFLRNPASVKSAKTSLNTTATNDPSGSYGWFLDANALVASSPPFEPGLFP